MRALLLAALLAPAASAAPRAKDLSVPELAGQLFMIAIDTEIAAAREADIRAGRLGGALLRWDKFTGDEARAFASLMAEWSASSPSKIPFWVATDHEGGPLFTQRRYGVPAFPSSMALGAAGSEALTKASARALADELGALGIRVTFAPVLDVNSDPSNPIVGLRSYGEDPADAWTHGVAALRGYEQGGMLAVVKHFPGHGDTAVDSHLGLPVSAKTLEQLARVELAPFRAAFAAGAEAVMPAHMVFPALGTGPDQPVTLSSAAIEGFLRGKMGFKGLVFSDSLDMGAIANVRGSSEAAVAALEAGADVLLLGKGDFPSAFAAVLAAHESGRLSRDRLELSAERVLRAKRRQGLFAAKAPRPLAARRREANAELARRAAAESVTLVRDSGLLPLKPRGGETVGVLLLRSPRYSAEIEGFLAALRKRHPELAVADVTAANPKPEAIEAALETVKGASVLLLGTSQFGPPLSDGARELVGRALAGPAPVVHLSLMNPYDLALTTRAGAALALYGITDSSLEAGARLLFGEIPPRGRLPVSVPGAASRGDGLRR